MKGFTFTDTTVGNNLKPAEIEPKIIKALQEFCKKEQCHPVQVLESMYTFITEHGFGKTYYQVYIECNAGKGAESFKNWLARTRANPHYQFKWEYGQIEEERILP